MGSDARGVPEVPRHQVQGFEAGGKEQAEGRLRFELELREVCEAFKVEIFFGVQVCLMIGT